MASDNEGLSQSQEKYNLNGNLIEQARGHWLKILAALCPALHPAIEAFQKFGATDINKTRVGCPATGAGKDGFRLFNDAEKNEGFISGGGVSNKYGTKRNGVELLLWLDEFGKVVRPPNYKPLKRKNITKPDGNVVAETDEQYRRREIKYLIGLYLSHGSALFPEQVYVPEEHEVDHKYAEEKLQKTYALRRKNGQAFWAAGIPQHPYFVEYLKWRGFEESDIEYPAYTRVVMQLPFFHDDKLTVTYHPVILTPLMKENKIVSLNQIYLDLYENGQVGKAVVNGAVKKIFKWDNYKGAACRLYPIPPHMDTLVVTEGIETAMAVRILSGGLPVWALLNANNLASFVPPPGLKTLIVGLDYDAASGTGAFVFEKLKERLAQERPEITLIPVSPESYYTVGKGIDWEDVYTNKALRETAKSQWKQFSIYKMEPPDVD